MNLYILVNIGCIECNISSNIVGAFTNEERAEELAAHLNKVADWRNRGQNSYEVFKFPEIDVVNPEYEEYL